MILDDLFEMSSGGSTSAGSVASINTPLGGASGFDRDYSKSIYDAPAGIKTRRKKRKKVIESVNTLIDNNQVAEYIQQNCKEALSIFQATGKYLLREVRELNSHETMPYAFLGSSKTKRAPVDTHQSFQQQIDKKLSAAGFKALRNNSIFCGSRAFFNASDSYSADYIIFPVDGFSITWSPKIHDITNTFKLAKKDIIEPDIKIDAQTAKHNRSSNSFRSDLRLLSPEQFVAKYRFKNNNLRAALQSSSEILINGSYIAIELDRAALKLFGQLKKIKASVSETLIGSTKPYKEPKVLSATEKVKSTGPILGGNPNKRQKPLNKKFVGCSMETPADKVISEKPYHKSAKPAGPLAQYKCINTVTRNGKGTQCGATFVSAKDEKLRYGKKCPNCGSGTAFHDKIIDLSESKMKNLNKAMWKKLNESKLKSTPENVYKVANILAEKYHSLFKITEEDMANQLIDDFANADNGLSSNDLAINDLIDLKKPANMHGKVYKIGTDDDKDETIISFEDIKTGKKYTTNIGNVIKKH